MADGEINLEMLDLVMAGLMKDYHGNIVQIKDLIEEIASDLNEEVAKCILYYWCPLKVESTRIMCMNCR